MEGTWTMLVLQTSDVVGIATEHVVADECGDPYFGVCVRQGPERLRTTAGAGNGASANARDEPRGSLGP